ncbi:MAG: hypothetical protein WCK70_06265 [Chloroflexales bacterium]
MTTNRASTFPLNRAFVTNEMAAKNRGRIDTFLQEPFANPDMSPLVFGPVRVNNNIFISLFRVFRVMPGTSVVVVGNGQVLEILTEGSYHALSFPVMNRIDLYVVNVRERTLDIETEQEINLILSDTRRRRDLGAGKPERRGQLPDHRPRPGVALC